MNRMRVHNITAVQVLKASYKRLHGVTSFVTVQKQSERHSRNNCERSLNALAKYDSGLRVDCRRVSLKSTAGRVAPAPHRAILAVPLIEAALRLVARGYRRGGDEGRLIGLFGHVFQSRHFPRDHNISRRNLRSSVEPC